MENMEIIYQKKEEALRLLQEQGELSMRNLEAVCYLVKIVKNACEVENAEQGGGYSRNGEWSARGMYGRSYDGGSYDGGYSGRRDSRGRYSRDGGVGGGYSDRGYSGHEGKEELMNKLTEAMNDAGSHQDKQVLRQAMDVLKRS